MQAESRKCEILKDLIELRKDWLENPDYQCFWSSPNNPNGLRLTPEISPGKLKVEMQIEKYHSGFPGISHGGIPFTVLDGMMSWYLMSHFGRGGFTRTATISYSRPLFVGKTYIFEVTEDVESSATGNAVCLKGLVLQKGAELEKEKFVSMSATFILPDRSLAEKILGKRIVESAKDIFPEA